MIVPRKKTRVVLGLTPLIDVVFILLIFFMLVSQFTEWRKIDLTPGATLSGASSDTPSLALDLLNDGTLRVDGKRTPVLSDAVALIAADRSRTSIMLGAEDQVAIQRVVEAVDALSAQGLTDVQLLPDPLETES